MELWIRSQDKRILQKVDNVYLNANNENRRIYTNDSRDYESELGEYATKERALEVLDEIQNILTPKCIIDSKSMKFSKPYEENGIVLMDCNADARLVQLSTYVYEMPKE